MAQSSENCKEMVQWTVSVPKELDDDVQTFMNTFRFGEQMDMAQLLDNALSSYMMVEVSRKMREASRGLDMSESEWLAILRLTRNEIKIGGW